MSGKPVIFLDRDGTINIDVSYAHLREQWLFCDKAQAALRMFKESAYTLAIATGQSGIGRGMYPEADMHALHTYMHELLKSHGVRFDAIAFCPHTPEDGCKCRKPAIGMLDQIKDQLGDGFEIDFSNSWMIGDKPEDVGFGKAIGVRTVLIHSRYWKEEDVEKIQPDLIVDSLFEAAQHICN